MTRLALLGVVLMQAHHIEGQCKPWTPAGLAAKRAAERFADSVRSIDLGAVRQAAQDRRTALLDSITGRNRPPVPNTPAPTVQGTTDRVNDSMTPEGRPTSPRPALGPAPAAGQSLADQLRRHREGQA
jgi:hypothetical protein